MRTSHATFEMSSDDISILLKRSQAGDESARDSLFQELDRQLRGLASRLMGSERPDHTLQATALINEACLQIIEEGAVDTAANRRQLFHSAIRAMRQVLQQHARARNSQKRGGKMQRTLDLVLDHFEATHETSFLDLDAALERLREQSPREHEAITLRFFGGLTVAETARITEVSVATIEADCRLARAKLMMWMEDG